MKKLGFTLAEILITLTIIGVVAAVTLPALQQNLSNRGLEAQTTKFYRNLSEAVGRYMVDRNADTVTQSSLNSSSQVNGSTVQNSDTFIQTYFKVSQRCGSDTDNGCFASGSNYTSFNGNSAGAIGFDTAASGGTASAAYVLADGAVFKYIPLDKSAGALAVGVAEVDVNGPKKPNRNGYDRWKMYIFDDGTVDDYGIDRAKRIAAPASGGTIGPALEQSNDDFDNCKGNSTAGTGGTNAYGCLGKFIRNGYKYTDDWQ